MIPALQNNDKNSTYMGRHHAGQDRRWQHTRFVLRTSRMQSLRLTDYLTDVLRVLSTPSRQMPNVTPHYVSKTFHQVSFNSLFIHHPAIQRCIVSADENVIKDDWENTERL